MTDGEHVVRCRQHANYDICSRDRRKRIPPGKDELTFLVEQLVIQQAANSFEIETDFCGDGAGSGPWLFGSSQHCTPCKIDAEVEILVERIADFPDFKAGHAISVWLGSGDTLLAESNKTYVRCKAAAQRLPASTGLWLPVSYGSDVVAAMHIGEPVRGNNVFRVELFVDRSLGIPNEGSVLRRRVSWVNEYDGKSGEAAVDVAKVQMIRAPFVSGTLF